MDELRRRVGGQKENGNGRKFNELEEARVILGDEER